MDQNRYPAVPMLGAAYYPEDWDESEQEKDIAMMCKAGINTVRIAEFAWSCMEPSDGDFRFDWLHRVIDRLKALVDAEDRQHPLSDEKLSELLKGEGFPIARRTVAKYRALAGIPGTNERRA